MQYLQPDFYRFSEDSIHLAHFIYTEHKHDNLSSFLDLFAGCGVIGIEVAKKLNLKKGVFVEAQKDFETFLNTNLQNFIPELEFKIEYTQISKFNLVEPVDICFANPPYFNDDEGRPSSDNRRHLCRHLALDDQKTFLNVLKELRRDISHIYFLNRLNINDPEINLVKRIDSRTSIFKLT